MERDYDLYSEELYANMCQYFNDIGFKFEKDDNDLVIHSIMIGDDLPMPIHLSVNPKNITLNLTSELPFTVPEKNRDTMAIAVSVANSLISVASFDYYYPLGKIVFRLNVPFTGCTVSSELFHEMMSILSTVVDEFNDKLLNISISDGLTPQKIFEMLLPE